MAIFNSSNINSNFSSRAPNINLITQVLYGADLVKEAYSLSRLYTIDQPKKSESESIPDALDLTHLEGKMHGSGTLPRDVLEVVAQAY